MKGAITCGGSYGPTLIDRLHRDLEPFGNPVEISVLRHWMSSHFADLSVVTVQVITGDLPATLLLRGEAIDMTIKFYFDTAGPAAIYKSQVSEETKTIHIERNVTTAFVVRLILTAP